MRNFILSALILTSAFQTALGQWTIIVENPGSDWATITASTATGAVTIPSEIEEYGVKKLGNGHSPIFGYNNTSVTSITIPNSVTSIGDEAFRDCTRLARITIPNSVTSIGGGAFANCTSLTSITIPFTTTLVGSGWPTIVTRDYTSLVARDDFINALVIRLASTLASNEAFVTAVANKIKGTSGNYGLTTQTGLSSAIEPLATKTQITTAINEGKASGIASVTASPNIWSLFTTSQIQNMTVGDLVLTRTNGSNLVLNYDIEQSEDLQTWTTYQAYALPLTNLPTNKAFVRIKAKQ